MTCTLRPIGLSDMVVMNQFSVRLLVLLFLALLALLASWR